MWSLQFLSIKEMRGYNARDFSDNGNLSGLYVSVRVLVLNMKSLYICREVEVVYRIRHFIREG